MIRVHRGRGGLVINPGAVVRAGAIAVVIVTLAVAGCSSKKKPGEGANGPGGANGQGGIGENGLGGSNSSSLANLQRGKTGSDEGPLSDIHFDYNDFTIRDQDSEILKTNGNWLQSNPQTHVQIEGHCDDRGSEEYNIALGAKRAQAAKDYLQTLGISGDRISTISYGKELPLCSDETDDCWAQNRRDHFAVNQ
jgi:peptidoglycan-associated lipoprotein